MGHQGDVPRLGDVEFTPWAWIVELVAESEGRVEDIYYGWGKGCLVEVLGYGS